MCVCVCVYTVCVYTVRVCVCVCARDIGVVVVGIIARGVDESDDLFVRRAADMSTVEIAAATDAHPTALALTLAFKTMPIVGYITCTIFNKDFVQNFVGVVSLLACDFWVTKNVSGRLLVGLRFWNEIDAQGNSQWRFESRDAQGMARVNAGESRAFWTALYGGAVVWLALFIGALAALEFNYALIPLVALILSTTNVVGYFKCSKDQKDQLTAFASRQVASQFFSAA